MEYIFLSFSMTVTFPLILLIDWFLSNLKGQTILTFLDSTVKTAIIILFLVPLFHYWHCCFCSLSVFTFTFLCLKTKNGVEQVALYSDLGVYIHKHTYVLTLAFIKLKREKNICMSKTGQGLRNALAAAPHCVRSLEVPLWRSYCHCFHTIPLIDRCW